MSTHQRYSRRRLLGHALGAAAAGIALPHFLACRPTTSPSGEPLPSNKRVSPNEEIRVGIIGCGRRNGQLVIGKGGQGAPPPEARIVAVADFNKARAEQWARDWRAKAYQDYRALLDQKDVDVIIYATPEHWHYLPCIHACQAGKHMYGEQPLSHTIREGRAMIQAVRKYKRIFQTGEQQRSHPATRKAVELIRNGRIGKIQAIIGYNYPSAFRMQFSGAADPGGTELGRLVRSQRGGAVPHGPVPFAHPLPARGAVLHAARGEIRRGPRLDVVPPLFGR